MFLSSLTIENFRCIGQGDDRMVIEFQEGLTALIGANDAGKTAVIDALRFALGTSDQERLRIQETDFHKGAREIRISCKFEKLGVNDQAAFAEFLTYSPDQTVQPVLYLHWTVDDSGQARAGRPYYRVETRTGELGDGPHVPQEIRILLHATYLRPLRDAEEALSAGRYSRLSQVLKQSAMFKTGANECDKEKALSEQDLSLVGIAKLFTDLLAGQKGVADTRNKIDATLASVTLATDSLTSRISVSGADSSDDVRLRELLEKLDLRLSDLGKMGLGSDNILFMACELLLLGSEKTGNKMLLIEEPEAHLHAQRQLQLVRSLQSKAETDGIQIILTTHSPNLSSVIDLDNLVMIRNRRAFPLAKGWTKLEGTDRSFLQRFLDVTKANLFFACGVVIVEGDSENILLPCFAKLIGRDFTAHGVSVVNVGGVGLGRYSRIFQRSVPALRGTLNLPVACITDLDVMPNCAVAITGLAAQGAAWPPVANGRKWRAKCDIGDATALEAFRERKCAKFDGQEVKTYVADEWTLEYNIALGNGTDYSPFAELMWVAISLAAADENLCEDASLLDSMVSDAAQAYRDMKTTVVVPPGENQREVWASKIYSRFKKEKISKPVAAQYVALLLKKKAEAYELTVADIRRHLPAYLIAAIEYVTGGPDAPPQEQPQREPQAAQE